MAKNRTPMQAIIRKAADWPLMSEVADDYSLDRHTLRRAIERGDVEAVKLGHIRVNPESVETWLASRYSPGR